MSVLTYATATILAVPFAADGTLTVRTLDGKSLAASALELDATAATFRVTADAGPTAVPLADVVGIEFARGTGGFDAEIDVELVDGSRFAARLSEGVEDSLAVEVPALGRRVIPLEVVRGVAFGDEAERAAITGFDPTAGKGEDFAARRGKSEGDRVGGTIVRIGREGVVIANDLGEIVLPPGEVLAATLATEAASTPGDADAVRVELDLRDGGNLRGTLVGMRGDAVILDTLLGGKLEVGSQRAERVRFFGARFDWLSDLEPSAVEETPYFGGDDDFLFPWRKDRSVTGEVLACAGTRYGKGLGLHSRSRLSFALDGRYASFTARAGVCDEVVRLGLTGSVVFRVTVDDRLVFESRELHAGEASVEIPPVDLKGKQTLKIELDFGSGGDVGDRAALFEPLLVRG